MPKLTEGSSVRQRQIDCFRKYLATFNTGSPQYRRILEGIEQLERISAG